MIKQILIISICLYINLVIFYQYVYLFVKNSGKSAAFQLIALKYMQTNVCLCA